MVIGFATIVFTMFILYSVFLLVLVLMYLGTWLSCNHESYICNINKTHLNSSLMWVCVYKLLIIIFIILHAISENILLCQIIFFNVATRRHRDCTDPR